MLQLKTANCDQSFREKWGVSERKINLPLVLYLFHNHIRQPGYYILVYGSWAQVACVISMIASSTAVLNGIQTQRMTVQRLLLLKEQDGNDNYDDEDYSQHWAHNPQHFRLFHPLRQSCSDLDWVWVGTGWKCHLQEKRKARMGMWKRQDPSQVLSIYTFSPSYISARFLKGF